MNLLLNFHKTPLFSTAFHKCTGKSRPEAALEVYTFPTSLMNSFWNSFVISAGSLEMNCPYI